MQIFRSFRRHIATFFVTAGLAFPACAAVCPKGIGGCTAPGRCFLFTDADGNSLCDYTGRTGSSAASNAIPSLPGAPGQAPSSASATAASSPDVTSSVIPGTTSTASSTIPLFPLIAGAIIFLSLTGIFFLLIRRGFLGAREQRTFPALALAAIPSLCIALVVTNFLAGGVIAGTVFALAYISAGTLLAGYLWYAGVMTRHIALGLAGLGTLTGFVFLAPIMPLELGGMVNVLTGTSVLTGGVLVIGSIVALALVLGRVFCGNICPAGSLQELSYAVPVKKVAIRQMRTLEIIRLAVFIATVIAAVYFIDLMAITGLYDFFSLALTGGFIIAAGLVLLSVFVYRPVCRVLCPFGVLFSILSEFSLFRLRRTEACINCKKCEIACPTCTAGRDDSKRECYLCGRCTKACPRNNALLYGR